MSICRFISSIFFNSFTYLLMQVSPESKKKSLEAKSRGDEAFKRSDYLGAIDAYTQVLISVQGN